MSQGAAAGVGPPPPATLAAPKVRVPTYQVAIEFNPAAPGMQIRSDLTIEHVVPGSSEQVAGVFVGSKVVAVNSIPVADVPTCLSELVKSVGTVVRLDLTFPAVNAPASSGLGQ
eukprot:COSAG02_NODE_47444_length_341_cov_0.636364_1_plen_113_part_11